jgi:hypothetical protein
VESVGGVEGRLQVGEVHDATRRGSKGVVIIVSVGIDPASPAAGCEMQSGIYLLRVL